MREEDIQTLLAAIEPIVWPCYNCQTANETPRVLWNTVKSGLICKKCSYMQNYPDHISRYDPSPPDFILERAKNANG